MNVADTDVLIDFHRNKGQADRVELKLNPGHLATINIAAFELFTDIRSECQQKAEETLLAGTQILSPGHNK